MAAILYPRLQRVYPFTVATLLCIRNTHLTFALQQRATSTSGKNICLQTGWIQIKDELLSVSSGSKLSAYVSFVLISSETV